MIDHVAAQTPVRDQGPRPTCTGFAVAAGHEWMSPDGELRSAEDVIWAAHEIRGTGPGEAVSVQAALGGLQVREHAAESAWPYGEPHWTAGRPAAALQGANRRALPPWRRLTDTGFETIRAELAVRNAVVLTVGLVHRIWQDPTGVIDASAGLKVPGKHAVLVVGASEEGEGPEELRVKNSWGPHWGNKGYGRISRRYLEAYGVCAHAIEAP